MQEDAGGRREMLWDTGGCRGFQGEERDAVGWMERDAEGY